MQYKVDLKQRMRGHGLKVCKLEDGRYKPKTKKEMFLELAEIEGGSLEGREIKELLDASYDNKIEQAGDFILDKNISSKTSKVYTNPETGQITVLHQGTQGVADWANNLAFAVGGKKLYKKTGRYKEAKRVQDRASAKYGNENMTTLGHSQGGLQAEMLGRRGNETITVNKATRPFSTKRKENQYDIRTSKDIVSALNPFEHGSKLTFKKKGLNPLAQHSYRFTGRLGTIGKRR